MKMRSLSASIDVLLRHVFAAGVARCGIGGLVGRNASGLFHAGFVCLFLTCIRLLGRAHLRDTLLRSRAGARALMRHPLARSACRAGCDGVRVCVGVVVGAFAFTLDRPLGARAGIRDGISRLALALLAITRDLL